jgi:hypothetical protein
MTGVSFNKYLQQTEINRSRIEMLRKGERIFSVAFKEISSIALICLLDAES